MSGRDGGLGLSALSHDVRHAVRGLLRHPGVAGTLVALLGVGVGVCIVAFSTVYGLLVRPLPYVGAEEIVRIGTALNGAPGVGFLAKQQFAALDEAAESFAQVAAWTSRTMTWVGPEGPEALQGASVSPSLLPLLKGTLHVGRSFAELGNREHLVVLLSYRTWIRRFDGDPEVVGMVLDLGGRPYRVAGVLSEGVDFPGPETEFWIPIVLWSSIPGGDRVAVPVAVAGRLRPGVSAERAQTEVRAILEQWFGAGLTVARVVPLREARFGVYRPALALLSTAAGALLLLVGASVTGLLLARLTARQRELAVCGVLGATRGRIVRGLLVESVVLSFAGGGVGLLVAACLQQVVRALVPAAVAQGVAGLADGGVLAFTLGASVSVGLFFGAVPALYWLRGGFLRSLREASTQASGGFGLLGRNRTRAALVVTQVAVALVLLLAAGLLMRSLVQVLSVESGYDSRNVLTARVGSPDLPHPYLDGISAEQGGERFAAVFRFYQTLVQRLPVLEEMREVEGVGLSSTLPLTEPLRLPSFRVVGNLAGGDPGDLPRARETLASPGYFEVLRPYLRAGRLLAHHDTDGSPRVAVVNETFARRFLRTPVVGERLVLRPDTLTSTTVDVVGVVSDFRVPDPGVSTTAEIFLSTSQLDYEWPDEMFVSIRTAGDPWMALPFLRRVLSEVNPRAVLKDLKTMAERRSEMVAEPQVYAMGAGLVAAFALLLAACSLYSVLSYTVWQRRREFGVRLALGARRGDIFRLVLRQGGTLVAVGIALGLATGTAATRLLGSLLFGITPMDLPIVVTAAGILVGVAVAAGYTPARRAVSVAAMDVLRCE